MAGRAYLYGLGAAGERGVDHVLALLAADHGAGGRSHRRRPHPRRRLRRCLRPRRPAARYVVAGRVPRCAGSAVVCARGARHH
jgi:hypothetical protein